MKVNSHAFNNQSGGLLDLQNDNALAGVSTFNNSGTFRKSGGSGTTQISSFFNNNGGTLDAEAGTLSILVPPNPGDTFNGGTVIAGQGAQVNITGNNAGKMAFTGTVTGSGAGSFIMSGGTYLCSLDGGSYAACANPASFTVADGSHALRVEAKIRLATSAAPRRR